MIGASPTTTLARIRGTLPGRDRARGSSPRPARERGVSLVEVLIAMTILLMICLAVLSMFTRSVVSTFEGRDYSVLTNHGRTEAEQFFGAAFESDRLRIDAGEEASTSARWVTHVPGAPDPGRWVEASEDPPEARWDRTSRVRQFNLADLLDGEPGAVSMEKPLTAGTPPSFVHLKEVTVEIQGLRETRILGPPKRLVLHTLRAY